MEAPSITAKQIPKIYCFIPKYIDIDLNKSY